MIKDTVSLATKRNRQSIQSARAAGRREVRGLLADADTSKQFDEMAKLISKPKLGQLLSAMVALAHQAHEDGRLVISDDGAEILDRDAVRNTEHH